MRHYEKLCETTGETVTFLSYSILPGSFRHWIMKGANIVVVTICSHLRPLIWILWYQWVLFFHEDFVDRVWNLFKIYLGNRSHKLTCHLHYTCTLHILAYVYNVGGAKASVGKRCLIVKNMCRFTDIFTSSQAFSMCYLNPHMRQSYRYLCFCRWRKMRRGSNACRYIERQWNCQD